MRKLLSYFSFRGRTNRARYWLFTLALWVIVIGASFLSEAVETSAPWFPLFAGLLIITMLVAGVANTARRAHDRSKSAWWLLLFLGVPTVLGLLNAIANEAGGPDADGGGGFSLLLSSPFLLWTFIDLGCRKGVMGPNKYGDDPLGAPISEVFA